MADDLRKDLKVILQAEDKMLGLGVAQLLWSPDLLEKAVAIAEKPEKIRTIYVTENIAYYEVKGSKNDEIYQVIPNKYCTCYYYQDQVLKRKMAWTCKHEIAVQLKLASGNL